MRTGNPVDTCGYTNPYRNTRWVYRKARGHRATLAGVPEDPDVPEHPAGVMESPVYRNTRWVYRKARVYRKGRQPTGEPGVLEAAASVPENPNLEEGVSAPHHGSMCTGRPDCARRGFRDVQDVR